MESDNQVESIVRQCRAGRRAAFEELFALYQPRLKYYVRRLAGNDDHIDDTLQDIWLTVFKKIRTLKDDRSFGVWLYRIARNRIYDGFRRKERFVTLPEDDELNPGRDEPTFDAHEGQRLHRAMNQLKPYHKEVLTLCFIEQMPYDAIAEVIGCSIGTVRSRIFYAKKRLREEMENQNG